MPKKRPALTDRQREVIEYIRSHIEEYKFPPSTREIGDALGIACSNGVVCHLKALKKKGYLDWHPKTARSFTLI